MEQDIDSGLDRPKTDAAEIKRAATDRPTEYFSVRSALSGATQEFNNPREAGEAFFRADPTERPSVAHIEGNAARTMARTEIHGAHETGEPRYFKSLPDSHAPDAEFRAGFLNAMEASLTERLGKVDWGKEGTNVVERLDAGLRDDFEAFARREPEKAAVLWTDHTKEAAPGPELHAPAPSRDAATDQQAAAISTDVAEKPPVIAAGDWVTTDTNVELRPVAVETDRGIHTGYEAVLPEGEKTLTVSEQIFPNAREALRHAFDFYEGGEKGLEIAVNRAAESDRELAYEPDSAPTGLVIEHRDQPEFPRPETAIYAGEDPQLVLTLGLDTAATRELAEQLVADLAFRKMVAEHIPDAETTLGTGRFVDGEGSNGFLPDELLAVTAYAHDGSAEVLAKFPDEGPLSEALARHLTTSPVIAAYAEVERQRSEFTADPGKAISNWVEQSSAQIDRLPWDTQDDLRAEMQGIAAEAAEAFGVDKERAAIETPPRSTLYSTAINATSLVVRAEEVDLGLGANAGLKAGLQAAALEAGINGTKLERRLETGAANAQEETAWVKSDLAEVAAHHRLDLGDEKARTRASDLVDRFYEKAAELVHAARASDVSRVQDPLLKALSTMVSVHESQGAVAFWNEDQARDFAEEMKDRYGDSVLKDMAAGRTEALAKDVPDPAARQSMAAAVVSAAKEHPSLGLSAHEAEVAERTLATDAHKHATSAEIARDPAHNRDREF